MVANPHADEPGHFRSLFEEHPHGVFGLDLGGRVIEANRAAVRLSGYRLDDLLGATLAELIVDADHERAHTAFVAATQRRPQQLELRVRHRDGHLVDLAVMAIPWVVDHDVQGVYGIVYDVTERNRLARELEVTRQVAAASQAKSDFVARMSHEVRTPLTSILAAVELLGDTDLSGGAERDRAHAAALG